MTPYLLDTNMVSYIINGSSPAARSRLNSLSRTRGHTIGISAITAGEIRYGLARLARKGEGQRKQNALDVVFAALTIHPWDRASAEIYGRLRAQQEAIGKSLGPFDTQIAAHALQLGATVVSHDGDFDSVAGLPVEDWATDLPTGAPGERS